MSRVGTSPGRQGSSSIKSEKKYLKISLNVYIGSWKFWKDIFSHLDLEILKLESPNFNQFFAIEQEGGNVPSKFSPKSIYSNLNELYYFNIFLYCNKFFKYIYLNNFPNFLVVHYFDLFSCFFQLHFEFVFFLLLNPR